MEDINKMLPGGYSDATPYSVGIVSECVDNIYTFVYNDAPDSWDDFIIERLEFWGIDAAGKLVEIEGCNFLKNVVFEIYLNDKLAAGWAWFFGMPNEIKLHPVILVTDGAKLHATIKVKPDLLETVKPICIYFRGLLLM